MAAACFAVYVLMRLFPPPQDPMDLRDVVVGLFWLLAIASLVFRQADDLPLFLAVVIASLILIIFGEKEEFRSFASLGLLVCAASVFWNGVIHMRFPGWELGERRAKDRRTVADLKSNSNTQVFP
jgi:hypothetical protein